MSSGRLKSLARGLASDLAIGEAPSRSRSAGGPLSEKITKLEMRIIDLETTVGLYRKFCPEGHWFDIGNGTERALRMSASSSPQKP